MMPREIPGDETFPDIQGITPPTKGGGTPNILDKPQ
jgi:hypothetical protein